jgi:hypothetical protein
MILNEVTDPTGTGNISQNTSHVFRCWSSAWETLEQRFSTCVLRHRRSPQYFVNPVAECSQKSNCIQLNRQVKIIGWKN